MAPRHTPERENGIDDTSRSEVDYNGPASEKMVREAIEDPYLDVEELSPEMQAVVRGTQEEIDLDLE